MAELEGSIRYWRVRSFGKTIRVASLASLLLLLSDASLAQQPGTGASPCPPAPPLESQSIEGQTKVAVSGIVKYLTGVELGGDVKIVRNNFLEGHPGADQTIVVLSMMSIHCGMIWSDTTLTGAQKSERFAIVMQGYLERVSGPKPIARTDEPEGGDGPQGRGSGTFSVMRAAFVKRPSALQLAQAEPTLNIPEPRTGFLRDAPYLVNDFNKYFVIVGSPSSKEEGLRLLRALKKKAPQYDYVLYAPYGRNPHYAVMMATWVPLDVAQDALARARQDVVADAYLWSCRSSGESC